MAFIWKFILREYELSKFDFGRQTCWAQIFYRGQKNDEKIEKLRFFGFSKGFSLRICICEAINILRNAGIRGPLRLEPCTGD